MFRIRTKYDIVFKHHPSGKLNHESPSNQKYMSEGRVWNFFLWEKGEVIERIKPNSQHHSEVA